jgi:two-component sensor histidine kinase
MALLTRLQRIVTGWRPRPATTVLCVVGLVALPTLARMAMQPVLGHTLWFATYYPAILFAGLLLDWRSACAVLLLSTLAADILFVSPSLGLSPASADLVALGVFLIAAGLILLVAAGLREALTRLQFAHQREHVLNDELRHRMRNMLAVVQGLAYQTMKGSSPEPDAFYHTFEGRLGALGRAHGLLADGDWRNYRLADLIGEALAPFSNSGRISMAGDDCSVPAESCVPLTLVLHELATNALKYGALSNGEGNVSVNWSCDGGIRIDWVERNGPTVVKPKRRGLGSRLIARQPGLEAVDLRFEAEGVVCGLTLKAAA